MGRRNRRAVEPEPPERPAMGGYQTVEPYDGVDYTVRFITGSASTKSYRCPGCDQEIRPATPHVVAWPADEPEERALPSRRHWHKACWQKREQRRARRTI